MTQPKKIFHTAPLDDDIWLEDQTPDRQLCIHDESQPNHLCVTIQAHMQTWTL